MFAAFVAYISGKCAIHWVFCKRPHKGIFDGGRHFTFLYSEHFALVSNRKTFRPMNLFYILYVFCDTIGWSIVKLAYHKYLFFNMDSFHIFIYFINTHTHTYFGGAAIICLYIPIRIKRPRFGTMQGKITGTRYLFFPLSTGANTIPCKKCSGKPKYPLGLNMRNIQLTPLLSLVR